MPPEKESQPDPAKRPLLKTGTSEAPPSSPAPSRSAQDLPKVFQDYLDAQEVVRRKKDELDQADKAVTTANAASNAARQEFHQAVSAQAAALEKIKSYVPAKN